ncbi:MAG: hypothetical protein J0M24_28050 [Verrucomicrobia bacterium]|nr:hypothetical protein [Verrucomicrobiota bacterium]
MRTIALILLCSLAAWWGLLTLWAISCHRNRVRAAATQMTPEELEDFRKLEASLPRYHMRLKDWVVVTPFMIPFVLFLLPIYLYHWLVKDPYKKHDQVA